MPSKSTNLYPSQADKDQPSVAQTVNDTEEELQKQKDLVAKCNRLHQQAKEGRRKYDWEWLVRNLYVRGYHFANYNRGTNTVVFSNRTGVRIPINLLWAHLRAVRNQVTSFRPKWEVIPNVTTESAFENAQYSGKVLDYIYEKSQIKRAIKELITHALLYSVGIWQFSIAKDGRIFVRTVDPYDLYIDPNIRSADINDPEYGAEFIDKAGAMPIAFVKNNPEFENTGELNGDNKIASAEYKQFLLQVTRQVQATASTDNQTIIVHETWFRERQPNGKFKMRIVHWTENMQKPLKTQLVDTDEYPWEVYQGDLSPLELYGESWAKHLIPLNRVIDALEGHIFEYNHLFARGRFVVDKNSGVRLIVNQHGQIIEKNRGSTVTSLPISPLPDAPFAQLRQFRQYFEDISGAHDVSLGRVPAGVKSGTGIAELKQADATNQDDLVDNLEDFLSRSGRKILNMVAENWTTGKMIQATGLGGKPDYFMVAGERAAVAKSAKRTYTFGEMQLPLAIIGRDNEVKVKVGSWLAYTKQARQDEIKDLFRLGAIDQKTLLEHLEFGDVEGVLQRTRDERLLQMRSSNPSTAAARQSGADLTDEEVALAENEMFLEGKDDPVEPDDDHEVHLAIHREIIDNKKHGDIIRAHMNQHLHLMRLIKTISAQELPPEQQGAEAGAPPPDGGSNPLMPSPEQMPMPPAGPGPISVT